MAGPAQGILTVLAVTTAAIAASVIALVIAHFLRLPRLVRPGSPGPASARDMVERLVAVADVARTEGLLSAENQLDPGVEPLLSRGIAWAVEGRSLAEIREHLDHALEAEQGRGLFARLAAAIGTWRPVMVIAAAVPVLLIIDGNILDPAGTAATTSLIAVLALVGAIGAAASIPLTSPASDPARLLWGMLQVAAVGLIRSGQDGAATREALSAMLPGSNRVAQSRAKAA
jgi:chemotaxis protein MotA